MNRQLDVRPFAEAIASTGIERVSSGTEMTGYRMGFPKLLSIALLVSCVAAVPAARANLIVNGSFETPLFPSSSSCGPFNDCLGYLVGDEIGAWFIPPSPIGGWFVVGNGGAPGKSVVLLLDNNYDEPDTNSGGTLNFHVADGFHALDLTGEGNQGLTNGVKQTIASTPGHSYEISFYVGNQYDLAPGYGATSSIGFYINGGFVDAYSNSANAVEDVTWQQFKYDFTALENLTTFAFLNNTPVGDNFAGLDNVVVSEVTSVPEPASIGVFGLGAFVFAVARRRKLRPL
jgi:hypothetical protein